MDERKILRKKLDELAAELRELEVAYERYFSGEEKREPLRQRTMLEKKIRTLSIRRIIRTDDRFKFETLAGRYHTYATHWNRIQRLIDEGKFERHLSRNGKQATSADANRSAPSTEKSEKLYNDLLQAHQDCALSTPPPDRGRFNAFLERQKENIQQRYGKRNVEFSVVVENGKPKLRAKGKN